jgi:hypothetical protein
VKIDTFHTAAVLADVLRERHRQVTAEGWSVEHDDKHTKGELAHAAGCYCRSAALDAEFGSQPDLQPSIWWPWDREWWKPKGARRDLIRAAALIVAEIERIDRRKKA